MWIKPVICTIIPSLLFQKSCTGNACVNQSHSNTCFPFNSCDFKYLSMLDPQLVFPWTRLFVPNGTYGVSEPREQGTLHPHGSVGFAVEKQAWPWPSGLGQPLCGRLLPHSRGGCQEMGIPASSSEKPRWRSGCWLVLASVGLITFKRRGENPQ